MRIFITPPGAKRSGARGAFSTLIVNSTQTNTSTKISQIRGVTQINMNTKERGYSSAQQSTFSVGLNNETCVWFNKVWRRLFVTRSNLSQLLIHVHPLHYLLNIFWRFLSEQAYFASLRQCFQYIWHSTKHTHQN